MIYIPLGAILATFLLDILLNVITLVSPCSAPWMAGAPVDTCSMADWVYMVESLATSAILGICGLIGMLKAVSGKAESNSALGPTSLICLVGAFYKLLSAWMFS